MNLPASFPLPLHLEWVGPCKGVFTQPFAYISKGPVGRTEIEAGFDTDFASIPRLLWNVLPPDGPYAPIAFIHDWHYWYQAIPREQADALLLEGMVDLGIGWLTRTVIYRAVRTFGQHAWDANARQKIALAMDPISPDHIKQHFHKIHPHQ